MQPGCRRISVFSETQNNALFLGLNLIKARQRPQTDHQCGNTPRADFKSARRFFPARHNAAKIILTFFKQNLYLGGIFPVPGILIIIVSAPRALRVRHYLFSPL